MKYFYLSLICLISLTLSAQVENDDCANAIAIGEVDTYPFDNIDATTDGPLHVDSPCPGGSDVDSIYNDLWYAYTPTFSGQALWTLCGTADFDTKIAVYVPGTACPPVDEDLLTCNEDFGTCANSTSELIFPVTSGETYLLRLGGFGTESPGLSGQGTFNVSEFIPLIANDFCSSAIPVLEGAGQSFSTFDSTTDGPSHDEGNPCFGFGDLTIGSDIWYNYTATFTGTLIWSTCSTASYDTRLGVYGPDADCFDLSDANLLSCNDDGPGCSGYSSQLFFDVVEGSNYLLRLGGFGAAQGDGTFDLLNQNPPEPPSNNDCATADDISILDFGSNETYAGTTIAATFDPSTFQFPPCLANTAGGEFAEVWYSFNNEGEEELILNFFSFTVGAQFFIDVWETCSTPTDTLSFFNNCTAITSETIALSDTLGLFATTPTDYILRVSTRLTSDIPGNFEFQLMKQQVSSVEEERLKSQLVLSPNPASDLLNIKIPLSSPADTRMRVYNLIGQEISMKDIGSLPSGTNNINYDISTLEPGAYVLEVIVDNIPITMKFIKQ